MTSSPKMPPGPGRPPAQTSRPVACLRCGRTISLATYVDKKGNATHQAKCYDCHIHYKTDDLEALPPPSTPIRQAQETPSLEQDEHWEEKEKPPETVIQWHSPFG